MERTVKETENQEECDRNNCWPMLDVSHLDSNKRCSREHHCCDGKAGQVVSQRRDSSTCKNSPVGIGEVGGVLEGNDKYYGRDHHWETRQDDGNDEADGGFTNKSS